MVLASRERDGHTILRSLLSEYKALKPDDAARNLLKCGSRDHAEDGLAPNEGKNSTVTGQTTTEEVQCEKGDEKSEVLTKGAGDGKDEVETETNAPVQADHEPVHAVSTDDDDVTMHSHVLMTDIDWYNCTSQRCFNVVRKDDTDDFDFVLTDPPYGTSPNPSGAGEAFDDHLPVVDFTAYSVFLH